ncbi:MAG: DNA primase [Candidatus Sulfotelmatobacter sp.]
MPSTDDFKETVKQQADIVRIIGDYIKLKKAGAQNYSGLCPFHGEKTPSFSVHATRQFYHCFGCGVSGDVFSFVQKIENITFPEALRLVAQKLGIPLPKATYSRPTEAKEAKLRAQLLDVQERAATFFQECLKRPDGSRAREYLLGRGLDQETIASFRIGYAPDSGFLLRDRLAADFSEEVLRESGLFSWKEGAPSLSARSLGGQGGDFDSNVPPDTQSQKPEARMYSKFRNRVIFPIANDAGKIIAFTGRTLATDEKSGPKYLNSPETGIYSKGRVLFNLDQAKEAIRKLDYAILVEGQMDCISVYAAGFHNVIASSGTAFTEIQAKLLGRFSKNVVVNFDPDTAGAKATERTLGLLIEEEFQIKVLSLEQGFDPDLYIRRKGRDAYGEALRGSQKYFDYLIDRARAHFPVRSAEGKVKAVNFLLPHIQRVPSRIVRDELSQEIAQKLGIDSAVLRQELRHVASERSAAKVKAPAEAQATDAERILVRALASARQMQPGEHLSSRDGAEEEFDPARQAQYAFQSEGLHRGLATESLVEALLNAGPEMADVMEVPCTDSERRMLASILLKEDEELTAERLEGACRALRRIRLRRQQEQVQRELKKPGISDDKERMKELLLEVERLSRALRDPSLAEEGLRMALGNQKTA